MVEPEYEPAFRAGFTHSLAACSSLGVTYTQLETSNRDRIVAGNNTVIRSMVIHPSSANAGSNWLEAQGQCDLDLRLVDLDYRRILLCGPYHSLNYLVGIRYANLTQEFRSAFTDIGVERIGTEVNFDGGGIRLGLEGERYARRCGLLVYSRAVTSLVGGEFSASYRQSNNFDPLIVDTHWKAGRVVPTLDFEIGVGWQGCNNRLRVTAGYMVSFWFNTVTTDDYIKAVRGNTFAGIDDGLSNTITFDGFAIRAEYRR